MKPGVCGVALLLMLVVLVVLIGSGEACMSARIKRIVERRIRFKKPYYANHRFLKKGSCVEAERDEVCGHGDFASPQMTWFPNLFGLRTQTQAREEVKNFLPCFDSKDSPYSRTFFCSIYYPQCTKNGKRMRLPCRNLCEASKFGCKDFLQRYGFRWPKMMRCDLFPTHSCFSGNVTAETLAQLQRRANGKAALGDGRDGANTTTTDSDHNGNDVPVNGTSPGLEASSPSSCCAEEIAEEDKPTDCVEGGYRCRNAPVVSFVDGETACCFNGRQLSYLTTCGGSGSGAGAGDGDGGGNGTGLRTACKCSYTTMPIHQGS